MTENNKVYLDTAPVIYFIEKRLEYYNGLDAFFEKDDAYFTSVITLSEFLTFPYKNGEYDAIDDLDDFLENMQVEVNDIDRYIANEAARIRARYPGFKLMDALQLASAVACNCTLFLTNDKQLKQFNEIEVCIVDELQ